MIVAEQQRTRAKISTQTAPTYELQALELFMGRWQVSGNNHYGAAIDAQAIVNGMETYEWMPGKYFLTNRWDRHFEKDMHMGIGVICYDAKKKEFIANNYDNLGNARIYKMVMEGNLWRFTGEKERAIMVFSDDGLSFEEHWETLADGWKWQPLCSLYGAKVD